MNVQSFLERWNRMGKQRQLLHILMCLLRTGPLSSVHIPLTELDEIGPGESVIFIVDGDKLVVRYAPEQVELLTIQEGAQWTQPNAPSPYANSQRSGSTLSDEKATEAEARRERNQRIRQTADKIRNKGLENLTDDLPPMT